jgi:hypothetical protein
MVIDDVITPFSSRIHSHRSAWARTQLCMLKDSGQSNVELAFGDIDKIREADVWVVSHGMEFKDAYNIFSGWQQEHKNKLLAFADKLYETISLEREMPNLRELLEPRAAKTEFNLSEAEWQRVEQVCKATEVWKHLDILPSPRRVVLGDSHSIARYRSESIVLRNDGLTLHGLLKRGIGTILQQDFGQQVERLVIQAGNIDIRHHLLRQDDPFAAVDKLLDSLSFELEHAWKKGFFMKAEITTPYPIEYEERRIPKTGFYKGTPFYGSRAEREDVRAYMTEQMNERFKYVYNWPRAFFDATPEEYSKDFMEKPGSVHLSPAFYEWDLEKNCERTHA